MASSLVHLLESAEDISNLHSKAVEEISAGNLKVIELVEGLSSHLTSTDEEKRRQGVSLLSNVIKNLPINHFNEEESDVLARFFCDRLKDRLIITPSALAGLESISLMKNIGNNIPMEIILALSMNVTAQTLPQSARLTYYGILKNLVFSKTDVLLKNSSDFVFAVISAMDSESDPRCLNYLFHFLPSLLSQFPLNHLAEEAFSVLECYFPVDFNPRDKSDISREDLALGLQDCLTATPAFAPFLIPTILEKLDSQLKIAHLDCLNLFIKGFEVWSLNDIKPHTSDIWKSLSKLLLPPSDNEVADLANKTLIALINAYVVESNAIYSQLDQLLEDISASTHGFLSDPKLSLFLPTTKLLGAVSMVSEHSCKYVIRTVLKQLLILLEQSSEKDITLSALTPLLCSSVKFSCWKEDNDVSSMLNEVPIKVIQLLSHPKARRGCFASLIEIILLLSFEQRLEVYKLIIDGISEFSPADSEMCCIYIKKIGAKYPTEVKENLLVKLNIMGNNNLTKKHFEIFCWCCQVLELTSYSIREILNHLSSESSTTLIDCLRELCVSADEKVLEIFGKELTVETLYKFALSQQCDNISQDDVTNISKIIQAIIRPLSSFCQQEVVTNCIVLHNSIYLEPEEMNNTNSTDNGSNISFLEDDNGLDTGLKWTNNQVFLLEGLLCPLRGLGPVTYFKEIIRGLINSSVSNYNSYSVRASASRTIASIINKCEVQEFELTIKTISKAIEKGGQKEVLLLSWITKSLIMKGSNDANEFLNKLTTSLKLKKVQREAAEGFKLILEDHECLSFKNYCNIRILYKQRMFYEISDLIMLLNQTESENNFGILLAVAYIIQKVPQSLIISGFNELIPVIVQSLDSTYSEVITVILEVIANRLESREQIFEGYMDTFIPRCLKCVDSSYPMAVRMQALNCLYYYGTYTEISILPFKERVLAGLIASLDDKKRLVRQRAVRARNRWFLVAALPET